MQGYAISKCEDQRKRVHILRIVLSAQNTLLKLATMAPPRSNDESSSISYTPEYNEFIAKVRAYHEKRGTPFEPEPKVGSKHIDLLLLYKMTMERGGYDKVSDTKLAWRKLGEEFGLPENHLPALAFALKSVYYRNLAAYEITTAHGKEPPPREILEDMTAKGGGLLTRTLENFRPAARKDTGGLGNEHSEASGDDGTPARDRHGSEEAPGSGGRVTRGLRQAPPQRVLFQPETQSSRTSRHVSTSHPSNHPQNINQPPPQPIRGASSYNPSTSTETQSATVANYEPRPQMPLTLRPVITPGNNPGEFARRQKALRDAQAMGTGRQQASKGIMFPGSKFFLPSYV